MPFPVDEKFIIETEQKLGVRFPDAFRQKMMDENGGVVKVGFEEWDLYAFFDTSNKKRLKRSMSHILRQTEIAREGIGFPEKGVAIANNGGGDELFLLPDKAGDVLTPTVYIWRHDAEYIERVADAIESILINS